MLKGARNDDIPDSFTKGPSPLVAHARTYLSRGPPSETLGPLSGPGTTLSAVADAHNLYSTMGLLCVGSGTALCNVPHLSRCQRWGGRLSHAQRYTCGGRPLASLTGSASPHPATWRLLVRGPQR